MSFCQKSRTGHYHEENSSRQSGPIEWTFQRTLFNKFKEVNSKPDFKASEILR